MNTFVVKYGSWVMTLAVVIMIIDGGFFSRAPLVIIGQVAGIFLMISGRVSFGKGQFRVTADPAGGGVIRRGPYRLIRHPIYTGAILLIWVSILGHLTILNAIIGMIVLATILYRISLEENLLRQHYPDYAEYAARTRKIIPFVY